MTKIISEKCGDPIHRQWVEEAKIKVDDRVMIRTNDRDHLRISQFN